MTMSRTHAARHIIELAGLPSAGVLLDEDALSTLLGRAVRTTRLRLKPATSLVVAWESVENPADRGWAAQFADPAKVDNAVRRARRVGEPVRIDPQTGVHWASPWADPQLAGELQRWYSTLPAGSTAHSLRYNPRRRWVLRVDVPGEASRVVRTIAAPRARLAAATARWRRLGAPVLDVAPLGGSPRTTVSPWWGHGDLLSRPAPGAARAAGAAIARVHRRAAPGAPLRAPVAALAGSAAQLAPWQEARLATLAPELAARIRADTSPNVHLHGDLSPDQVLTDGRDIRLIDLDRAGSGPAMRDVGSWLAACDQHGLPELGQAFLDGYTAVRGVDPRQLAAWRAFAHLASATEPFRRCTPSWPTHLDERLTWAEEAMTR